MQIYFDKTKVHYEIFGKGEPLVFLHGWGCSGNIFLPFADYFAEKFKVVLIDFPPFGKSQEPKNVWGVKEYAKIVNFICKKEDFKKINIIAHSFGGRVAINFANCYNDKVNKLILTGSAGLKRKKSISYLYKVYKYKLLKKFCKNTSSFGSPDYKKLSDHMKKIFIKIVNYFQEEECKKITCPTLIIHGKHDKEVSLKQAKKMHKLILNSKLIVFKKSTHFCFLEEEDEFFDLAYNFLTN